MTRVCGKIDPEFTTLLQSNGVELETYGQTRRGQDRVCFDVTPGEALIILEASVGADKTYISRRLAKQLDAQGKQEENQPVATSSLDLTLQSWSASFASDDGSARPPLYTVGGEGALDHGKIAQTSAGAVQAGSSNPVQDQIRELAFQVQNFASTDFYAGVTTQSGLVTAGSKQNTEIRKIKAALASAQEACSTLEAFQQPECNEVIQRITDTFIQANEAKLARYSELESSIAAQAQKPATSTKGKADSKKDEDNKPASSAERPRRR